MNKTDRLLAIVLELQRHGVRRAEDLAATFETSVRTIYRDVQALSEAGVPVVGAPGQGYSLARGYFLPPVSFRAEETEGGLLLTLRVRHPLEVLGWIMSWGPGAVVLEPESLRSMVRQKFIEALKRY